MLTSVAPANASDLVVVWNLKQLFHLRSAGAPDIDSPIKPDCQHVLAVPVDEVQVEVILQLRGIKYLEG